MLNFDAVHWSAGQIAYLAMVVGGLVAFAATLMGGHIYVAQGERQARRRAATVTAAVRPKDDDTRLAA